MTYSPSAADPESAVEGVDFVQERAPEREEIKQPLLARIDAVLPPEIVIASSSSGLLISRLQAGLPRIPNAASSAIRSIRRT